MPAIHRNGDSRACGATTIVTGQEHVYANGKLVSVDGDLESHGDGALTANSRRVYINGKAVVNVGDAGAIDQLDHTNTAATSGSPNVNVGDPL